MKRWTWAVALAFAASAHGSAFGQCLVGKIVSTDMTKPGSFGASVAIDGDTVFVGAPRHKSSLGSYSGLGAVFEFERQGDHWVQLAEIRPTLSVAEEAQCFFPYSCDDDFGISVDFDGDRLIVGSGCDVNICEGGSAFTFTRAMDGSWNQEQRIRADDWDAYDHFAVSVALDDDFAAIGAPLHYHSPGGFNEASYLFEWTGASWTQALEVLGYGDDVDVEGSTFVCGDSGQERVRVYEKGANGWSIVAELANPTPQAATGFGRSVAIQGDTLLVGAPWQDIVVLDEGVVFVFKRSGTTWAFDHAIVAPWPAKRLRFGWDLALSGDLAVVGTSELAWVPGQIAPGRAHVFREVGGVYVDEGALLPLSMDQQLGFGTPVAVSDPLIVGGLPAANEAGAYFGSAYVFSDDPSACPQLVSAPSYLSLASGGLHLINIQAGAGLGGAVYAVLGSASGTQPGISGGGLTLPLNVDGYFQLTLGNPNTIVKKSVGLLKPDGTNQAILRIDPGALPELAGVTLYHAYVVLDDNLVPVLASNADSVQLLP